MCILKFGGSNHISEYIIVNVVLSEIKKKNKKINDNSLNIIL